MFTYQLSLAKYKLRTYELELAYREIKGLFPHAQITLADLNSLEFKSEFLLDVDKLKRLTFFSNIKYQNGHVAPIELIPHQVRLEKLTDSTQMALFDVETPSTSRQIRYLTHALHEYKGRFYPQLAKSLLNYAGVEAGATLLDPFCGSGTSLVESYLTGVNAVGIDINPVAYLIAQAKIQSLTLDKVTLDNLDQRYKDLVYQPDAMTVVSEELDWDYIKAWFPEGNLKQVLFLLNQFEQENNEAVKLLLQVILSNLLRNFSYQDSTQLRIKRRTTEPPTNLFAEFQRNLKNHIIILQNFISFNYQPKAQVRHYLGDSKNLMQVTGLMPNSIDVVITSPPYATALPYIDTDRLSLFVFGYVKNRNAFRALEKTVIGNREITLKDKNELEQTMLATLTTDLLPLEVSNLIQIIYDKNKNSDVGFRRKNLAVLLFKYFADMKVVLEQTFIALKHGSMVFMVVGNNQTQAGGDLVKIPTDDFIGLIAQQVGFKLEQKFELQVQKGYMIHAKNAINSESILILRKV